MTASSAARRSRIGGGAQRGWLRRIVSPGVALALLFTAVAVVAIPYASSMVGFFIQPDELTYAREAMHFAETGGPTVPGDFWFSSYAQLFGLLAAPGFALWDTPKAFDYAHGVQAVAFASTAIPVFLLTRRVTESRWAPVLAAALAVLVPWVVITGSMLSEPVAYAVVPWALLAIQVCLERGDVRGDLIAIAGILLAFFARTQMVLLFGVLPLAILVHEVGFALARPETSRLRAGLAGVASAVRRHLLLVVGGTVLGLALLLGLTPWDVLGAYGGTAERQLLPPGLLAPARDMVAYAALGVGVLPLALAPAWWLATLGSPTGRVAHAWASLSIVFVPIVVVVAAIFSRNFGAAPQDRYTMYVAPVLAIGAALFLVDRRRSLLPLLAGVAFAAWVIGQTALSPITASMTSPARTTLVVLDGRFQQLGKAFGFADLSAETGTAAILLLAGIVIALARLRRIPPAVLASVVGTALIVLCTAQTLYTLNRFKQFQSGVSEEYIAGRDWIDRAVGDAKVTAFIGVVFDRGATPQVFWESTFFNKATDRIYTLPGDTHKYGQNFSPAAEVLPDGRIANATQRPYVLMSQSEARLGLRGARDVGAANGLALRRVPRPYSAIWFVEGADAEGNIALGKRATLQVFADGRPGPRDVTVSFMASPTAQKPYAARVTGAGRTVTRVVTVEKAENIRTKVRLPAQGSARVALRVFDPKPAGTPDPAATLRVTAVRVG